MDTELKSLLGKSVLLVVEKRSCYTFQLTGILQLAYPGHADAFSASFLAVSNENQYANFNPRSVESISEYPGSLPVILLRS